ncbi:cilia- and flagella-associated protein 299 [Discoglossus pictus]
MELNIDVDVEKLKMSGDEAPEPVQKSTDEDDEAYINAMVEQFETYEDFLDSQITPKDMFYLEDEELVCQLVEMGYRGRGDIVKREIFDERKRALVEAELNDGPPEPLLASAGKNLKDNFLKALALREEANLSGKMTTIFFIRDKLDEGQRVSAYIDYAHRLTSEDFSVYFSGKKKLQPLATDLSYYNWNDHISTSNSTPNYQLIVDYKSGLQFKNKMDRKIINMDPKVPPGDGTARMKIKTNLYLQAIFFDHITRRTL